MPVPAVMRLQAFGLLYAGAVSADIEQQFGPIIKAQVDQDLTPLLQQFGEQAERIRQSDRLTPVGKAEALHALGHETLAKIAELTEGRRGKLDFELAEGEIKTRPPTLAEVARSRDEDQSVTFQRFKELRDSLKPLDQLERWPALLEAATSGDTMMLAAVADADHPRLRLVSEDVWGKVLKEWIDRQTPPELKVAAATLDLYLSNSQTARRLVAEESGASLDPDPIAKSARQAPAA